MAANRTNFLALETTCTISWLDQIDQLYTRSSSFQSLSMEGLLSEAELAAAFMKGMSMKSLLYCFSPHDGAEHKSPPLTALKLTFTFLHCPLHTDTLTRFKNRCFRQGGDSAHFYLHLYRH